MSRYFKLIHTEPSQLLFVYLILHTITSTQTHMKPSKLGILLADDVHLTSCQYESQNTDSLSCGWGHLPMSQWLNQPALISLPLSISGTGNCTVKPWWEYYSTSKYNAIFLLSAWAIYLSSNLLLGWRMHRLETPPLESTVMIQLPKYWVFLWVFFFQELVLLQCTGLQQEVWMAAPWGDSTPQQSGHMIVWTRRPGGSQPASTHDRWSSANSQPTETRCSNHRSVSPRYCSHNTMENRFRIINQGYNTGAGADWNSNSGLILRDMLADAQLESRGCSVSISANSSS